MSPQAIAAIDLGTMSCRAEIFSLDGEPLGRHSVEYPLDTPAPDAAEQDAETWWQAACECLRGALKASSLSGADVLALGFSCQGHSWVPTDADFRPLRAAFTWLDRRSAPYAEQLLAAMGPDYWGHLAGKTPGPWHMLPQVLWLRDHEPEALDSAHHLLFCQDFLIARLTGKPVTDYTTAAATLFFDITANAWDVEELERHQLDAALLSQVVGSGTVVGTLNAQAAEDTGLSTRTLVVTGAQDQKCAALAAGLVPGIATASLGTATAIEALLDRPTFDAAIPIPCFPYLDTATWVLEAAISTTGGAVNWLRDALRPIAPDLSYSDLMACAAEAAPGCNGVIFFPYPAGAGMPHMRFDASAAFAGISLSTGISDLARAVLEACAYEIGTAVEAMRNAGCEIERLHTFGGGVRSRLWTEIIAATLDIPLFTCREAETALRGAAMLAARGALPDDQSAPLQDALRSPADPVTVSADLQATYADLFAHYARAREQYWPFQDAVRQEAEQ